MLFLLGMNRLLLFLSCLLPLVAGAQGAPPDGGPAATTEAPDAGPAPDASAASAPAAKSEPCVDEDEASDALPSSLGTLQLSVDGQASTQLLESTGATVVSFADELALFCAVARRPPTAIVLDVVLHWVDGLRLCEGLKQHPLTRNTRVVVMSGLNRPHVRQRALEAGAEAFLPKPVEPERLLQQLMGHGLPAQSAAPMRGSESPADAESGRYAS